MNSEETQMLQLLEIINKYGNLFVSVQSEDMKLINELERRNLIKTTVVSYGKICNPKN